MSLHKLRKNISVTLGRQILAGLIQLVILAIIARFYGADGNGTYTVALLLPTMLASLLNLGIAPANVYYLGAGKVSPRMAWYTTLKLYTGITLLGLLFGASILFLYAEQWFPNVSEKLLWFALLVFPSTFCLSLVSSLFQGLQNFKQFNLVSLLQPIVTLAIIVILVAMGVEDVGWLLFAYLIGTLITLLSAICILKPLLSQNASIQFDSYGKAVIAYGCKVHLSNILTFVNYKADIFLVNFFIGSAATGIYVIAVQIVERLWLLSQAVSTVVLPRLSQLRNDEGARRALTPMLTRITLLITGLAALALTTFIYPLVDIIFGNEFIGAITPFLILLPGIVAGAGARILANDIAARGRPELNMYTSILTVSINVVGNITLIPLYGLVGAALATTLAYILNLIARLSMYWYLTKIPFPEVIFIKRSDIDYSKKYLVGN